MHTRRPARLRHLSYLGCQRYSLTFCTDWKRKWFENADAVALVLSQFLRVADKEGFSILTYCFMPDHVHLLVEGLRDDSDARKLHVLRDDEDVKVVARYILENPVRAGLAKTVLAYPFVGSQVYDLKELVGTLPDPD
jgi:putative transposase